MQELIKMRSNTFTIEVHVYNFYIPGTCTTKTRYTCNNKLTYRKSYTSAAKAKHALLVRSK